MTFLNRLIYSSVLLQVSDQLVANKGRSNNFSGEEGVEAAAKEDFDVAVVDLQMPGIDGIEVQKRLKDLQPQLPCIILTGHGSVENALESAK